MRFVLRRLLLMLPMLVGITLISFAVMQMAPGDYLSQMREDPRISPEAIEQMRRDYGLDRPWYVQYALWLGNAARLNFGYSLAYHVPVTTLIGRFSHRHARPRRRRRPGLPRPPGGARP